MKSGWAPTVKRKVDLHLIYQVAQSYQTVMREMFGFGLRKNLWVSRKGIETSYRWMDDLHSLADYVRKECRKDEEYLDQVIEIQREEFDRYKKILNDRPRDIGEFYRQCSNAERRVLASTNYLFHVNEMITDVIEKFPAQMKEMGELRDQTAKKVFYQAYEEHYWGVYQAVSELTGLSLTLAPYLLPDEVISILSQGTLPIPIATVQSRWEHYVLLADGEKIQLLLNEEAEEIEQKYIGKMVDYRDVREVQGKTAVLGVVRGRVRIVYGSEEATQLRQGEIVVASMTRPQYAVYLSKAGGIVTDEGGILCHAMVLARELRKPCVIGTRIATEVFRNGDLVEIDAEKGIVKKI